MAVTFQARPGRTPPPGQERRAGSTPLYQRLAALVRRRRMAPYLLLVPSVTFIGVLLVVPTLQIALFSFQDYGSAQLANVQPARWVGFSNYATILKDPEFWLSLRITVIAAVAIVVLTLTVGTLVGLLLNRLGRKMSVLVSSSALLAWATPTIPASVIFYWLFNPDGGVADWLLVRMPHWLVGTGWADFNWLNRALPAYTVLTVLVVWQSFPFIAVSVLAGLKTIPVELYEAARVDGAGPWRVFWKITYPLLKPIFLVLLLLSVIWDFGIFTQSYILMGGLGNRDEYNLSIFAYSKAFSFPPSYGIGCALALVLTAVLLIITVGYVRSSVRQGATS